MYLHYLHAESHCVFHTPSRYGKHSLEHILAVKIIIERIPAGTASWLTKKETVMQRMASKITLEPAAVVATAPSAAYAYKLRQRRSQDRLQKK